MNHSPLPWELSDCDPYRVQSSCDGDLIVTTRFSSEKTPMQKTEDAALIVRACNNHKALRAMLIRLIAQCDYNAGYVEGEAPVETCEEFLQVLSEAKVLINSL